MNFILWQRGQIGVVSGRRVFRADEVPRLQDAAALVARLEALWASEAARVQAAADEARQAARRDAEAEARRQADEALGARLATLAREAEAMREAIQGEVAALALAVARKLLGELPAADRLAALARQAACELLPARTWRLAVHADDADALRAGLARLAADDRSGLARAEVVVDPGLPRGDCRLDTEFGSAQAGIGPQLARLAAAWKLPTEDKP